MKKTITLIIALFMVAMLANPCFAVKKAQWKTLVKSTGTIAISDYPLDADASIYSETLDFSLNVASEAILALTEDIAGGNGDVDISIEYCVDGCADDGNWSKAYASDLAGTITPQGNVVTAAGNTVAFIGHAVKLAPKVRYKFDADANSQITAKSIIQVEN